MFDVAPTELMLVALVALVVIGPKDLPRAMRFVGHWIGRARGVARHFRSGVDEMIRQAELEEMEKKWAAENERIMREYPPQPPVDGDMTPLSSTPVAPAEPTETAAPSSTGTTATEAAAETRSPAPASPAPSFPAQPDLPLANPASPTDRPPSP